MRVVLQKQLDELRKEKEDVTFGLDQTLRKLQNELHDITQHNNIELDSVAKEMNEAINKATADHELRMRQLQDRVDAMDRTVNGECLCWALDASFFNAKIIKVTTR